MRISFVIALVISISFLPTTYAQSPFDKDKLESVIELLASDDMEGRETGTMGEKRAADFIETMLQYNGIAGGGEHGSYFQVFKVNRKNPHEPNAEGREIMGLNVLGIIPGASDKTLVIGAHYDHLGYGSEGSLYVGEPMVHNGADDNASGVAGLLELGRVLSSKKLRHNVLLLAFSGEEKGLLGSNFFTKHATVPLDRISYMINMDMIGRLNEENKLAIHGAGTTASFLPAIEKVQHDFQLKIEESGSGPSDHASFYYSDIPVLSFFTGQHEDYHKPSDDEHLINYDGLVSILDYILEIILTLDNDEEFEFIKTQDSSQDLPRFKVTLGVMPDYLYSGKGMRIDGVSSDKTAAVAGLEKGDVVVKMGDLEVIDMMSYMKALGAFEPGQTTEVQVMRKGKTITKTVTFQ